MSACKHEWDTEYVAQLVVWFWKDGAWQGDAQDVRLCKLCGRIETKETGKEIA